MTGAEIRSAVDNFQQLEFTDAESGIVVKYNLFVPKNYDSKKKYPLVLFIHDAGCLSGETMTTLNQGIGGTIWATSSEQAKHESFVLAPQYSNRIVNDNSETTSDVKATVKLVKELISLYPIDDEKLYLTGQSMGCMASIDMLLKYPEMFSKALLVAGQWDTTKMARLIGAEMWIIVSEGDLKAFPGMNASMAALEDAGAQVSRATWNGRASAEEIKTAVSSMIAEGRDIKYTVLARGTVVPAGLPDDGINNHVHTWPIVYAIEGVRDWLFL